MGKIRRNNSVQLYSASTHSKMKNLGNAIRIGALRGNIFFQENKRSDGELYGTLVKRGYLKNYSYLILLNNY